MGDPPGFLSGEDDVGLILTLDLDGRLILVGDLDARDGLLTLGGGVWVLIGRRVSFEGGLGEPVLNATRDLRLS